MILVYLYSGQWDSLQYYFLQTMAPLVPRVPYGLKQLQEKYHDQKHKKKKWLNWKQTLPCKVNPFGNLNFTFKYKNKPVAQAAGADPSR